MSTSKPRPNIALALSNGQTDSLDSYLASNGGSLRGQGTMIGINDWKHGDGSHGDGCERWRR